MSHGTAQQPVPESLATKLQVIPTRYPFRILSIDGGGYLGLATAAFVRGIEDHFKVRLHDHFDLFCGTSTGAMLALALASGKTGTDLVDLYKQQGPKIFRKRPLAKLPWAGSLFLQHSNNALKRALVNVFCDETLDDLLYKKGKRALITSFCLTNGRPCLFKTDHSSNLTQHGGYRLADVAMCSTAAPTYFPLVQLLHPRTGQKDVFCDGGVAANHPALLGYSEALSECACTPDQLQILSLSTPRADLAERHIVPGALKRGLWGWRKSLAAIFTDSNAMLAGEMLKRITAAAGTTVYERISMENRHELQMNDAGEAATAYLEALGRDLANRNDVRARLRVFFENREER